MERSPKAFIRYAWFALAYNVLVILWGVFLRASKSGDGCGQHWLTCNGEVLPSAPQLKTIIEYSHRMMSALDGLVILVLVVWAFIIFRREPSERSRATLWFAIGSMFFVMTEAAVGAGLVLTGNTAETLTVARPFWMAGHLINTFILLAFLALTARRASGGGRLAFDASGSKKPILAAMLLIILLIGTSGSVAALASMLFPSATLISGLSADLAADSNILVRLRLLHPIGSVLGAFFLIFAATRLGTPETSRLKTFFSSFVAVQVVFGAATLLSHAPILMQIGHLVLADLIWITFILLAAETLSPQPVKLKSATAAAGSA